jgi:hypothetical protein
MVAVVSGMMNAQKALFALSLSVAEWATMQS